MLGEWQDFTFGMTFNGKIPDWGWREWIGRASRAAVEEIVGPIGADGDAGAAFEEALPTLTRAAVSKLKAANGQLAEPVLVDVADL